MTRCASLDLPTFLTVVAWNQPKQVVAKAPAPAAKPERKPERKPRAQAREGNDRPQRAERESGPYGGALT